MNHLDKNKLVDFLNKKIKNTKCPLCETDDWIISENLHGLVNLDIGNKSVCNPVVTVVCNECGYTILLQADKTGALTNRKEEE